MLYLLIVTRIHTHNFQYARIDRGLMDTITTIMITIPMEGKKDRYVYLGIICINYGDNVNHFLFANLTFI